LPQKGRRKGKKKIGTIFRPHAVKGREKNISSLRKGTSKKKERLLVVLSLPADMWGTEKWDELVPPNTRGGKRTRRKGEGVPYLLAHG